MPAGKLTKTARRSSARLPKRSLPGVTRRTGLTTKVKPAGIGSSAAPVSGRTSPVEVKRRAKQLRLSQVERMDEFQAVTPSNGGGGVEDRSPGQEVALVELRVHGGCGRFEGGEGEGRLQVAQLEEAGAEGPILGARSPVLRVHQHQQVVRVVGDRATLQPLDPQSQVEGPGGEVCVL